MIVDETIESSSSYSYNGGEFYVDSRIRHVVLDICVLYKTRRIICIGMNNEALSHYLNRAGYTVLGIKSNERNEANYNKLISAKEYVKVSNGPDQLGKASFDTAIIAELGENLSDLIKLAALNLHYGGVLILSTPCVGYLKYLLVSLRDRWNQRQSRSWNNELWSMKNVKMLLKSHGFIVAELIGIRRHAFQNKQLVWVARKISRPRNENNNIR